MQTTIEQSPARHRLEYNGGFSSSSGVNHQKYEETWLKLRKDLVTRYVLSFCQLLYY